MPNDLTNDIKEIIRKQTSVEYKSPSYPVLPPIGSASSAKTIPSSIPPSPPLSIKNSRPQIDDELDSVSMIEARRATPLVHSQSIPPINLSELPENEMISYSPTSSRFPEVELKLVSKASKLTPLNPVEEERTEHEQKINVDTSTDKPELPHNDILSDIQSELKRHSAGSHFKKNTTTIDKSVAARAQQKEQDDEEKIELVTLRLARIPDHLPDIPGLQNACENVSENRLQKILEACRLYDNMNRGHLSQPTMLKCIGEVIPSSHVVYSPWRSFLDYIAPQGEFITYNDLIEMIRIESRKLNVTPNKEIILPDILQSEDNIKLLNLPLQPSSSQEDRERGRVEIMMEIEVLMMQHPELNIDRIKMATTKMIIEPYEMQMILELYSIQEFFEPFIHRLLTCFQTADNKFHFAAFVGCLENVKPLKIKRECTPILRKAPWLEKPLKKNENGKTKDKKEETDDNNGDSHDTAIVDDNIEEKKD